LNVTTADAPIIYARIADGERLFMGEILANVIERRVITAPPSAKFAAEEELHPFCVVISQDCDLEQDARARADRTMDEKRKLNALVPHVLLLVGSSVEVMRSRSVSSDQLARVKQNKDERFHFLARVPAHADASDAGLDALVLDFKRFFSFPTDELLRRIRCGEIRRRGRLTTPYAEHLAVRFGFFLQRIGLDVDHHDAE
jgi:hypothetical protein